MKKYIVVLSSLTLATSVFAAPVPKKIQAQYDGIMSTIKTKDVEKFATYMTDDFVTIDPSGKKSTKAEFVGMVKSLYEGSTNVSAHVKFLGSKTHGGMVDVMFDFSMTITSKKGKTVIHEVGTDSWKEVGGKWLIYKTTDKSMDMKPGK